ncbi:MAG TPA: hypothetical protein V6C98_03910 [Thermosynechococcaceae cyanobacterium]
MYRAGWRAVGGCSSVAIADNTRQPDCLTQVPQSLSLLKFCDLWLESDFERLDRLEA